MAGAGKGSKSGDVKESTDSSTTIEEDEKGKKIATYFFFNFFFQNSDSRDFFSDLTSIGGNAL